MLGGTTVDCYQLGSTCLAARLHQLNGQTGLWLHVFVPSCSFSSQNDQTTTGMRVLTLFVLRVLTVMATMTSHCRWRITAEGILDCLCWGEGRSNGVGGEGGGSSKGRRVWGTSLKEYSPHVQASTTQQAAQLHPVALAHHQWLDCQEHH